VMRVRGGGAKAKARVRACRVELEACSGAGVRNADTEGQCRRRWAGRKHQGPIPIEN
jgi:hypothetical protein